MASKVGSTSLANFRPLLEELLCDFSDCRLFVTAVNVVATSKISGYISKEVMRNAQDFEVAAKSTRFQTTSFRIENCKVLFFSNTQKLLCIGCDSVENAYGVLHTFRRMIQRLGAPNVCVMGIKVENFVMSGSFGYEIDLMQLKNTNPMSVAYDPLTFPGARCRPCVDRKAWLVFSSGTFVGPGRRSYPDALRALAVVYRLVRPHFTTRVPLDINYEPCESEYINIERGTEVGRVDVYIPSTNHKAKGKRRKGRPD